MKSADNIKFCIIYNYISTEFNLISTLHIFLNFTAKQFDLILCDNVMPNMNGPEAVKRIRDLGYKGPIFGVTGNVLPDDIADFIAHGANAVIEKPLKISVLKMHLDDYFNHG